MPDRSLNGQPTAAGRTLITAPIGILLLVIGTWWTGFGGAQLGTVLLTQVDIVSDTLAPSPSWAVLVLTTSLGLFLLTSPNTETHRVDLIQLAGAVFAMVSVAFFAELGSGFEFTSPDVHCVYQSCWPDGYQQAAIATPLLLACLVMAVLATAGRHQPRWRRAATPAITYLLLTLLQVAAWDWLVIPVLNAPPPNP